MLNGISRRTLMLVLAIVLCFSMTAGSTIAWFTETVESEKNIIQAGNLDVELYYMAGDMTDWAKVEENTNLFKTNTLWEPGHTEVIKLKVANEGSLSLKYQLSTNVAAETGSTNVLGAAFNLSDHIKSGVIEGDQNYSREQAVAAVDASALPLSSAYLSGVQQLLPNAEKVVTMVVYMPTSVGNEANYAKGAAVPQITLGVKLDATQLAYESDSFGPEYDAGATFAPDTSWYTDNPDATEFTILTAEDLVGLAQIVNGTASAIQTYSAEPANDTFNGKTIYLGADIDLNNSAWTPIGRTGTTTTDFTYAFRGTFDGKNHTISNLNVATEGWAGLFGVAYKANIKNVNIDGVTLNSSRMTGSVVGQLYGSLDNCHVKNATIKVVPNAVSNGYDNGDKVGGIVGWIGDNGNNNTLTNCSATDVNITAYRDIGGIAGYAAWSTTIANNTVTNATIKADQTVNPYGYKDPNAGLIWGRNSVSGSGAGVIDSNNTKNGENKVTAQYEKDDCILIEDVLSGNTTMYLVASDSDSATINIPEGVTTIGGYAFAYNNSVETIVLPSTVKTLNDRAFRDTSASNVVLNEGLTNISYQAFRNAVNVKSVVIPSTVTTISKEAFQSSGITTLTIPANVTTIEYGGCRDMKELETVTIKGNVDIPVYAFRACTNLKTVILEGNDVTFGAGSRGMIFTNKESGDGSAITVYVANETVKDRLLAADTAAKDYGGYKIVVVNP